MLNRETKRLMLEGELEKATDKIEDEKLRLIVRGFLANQIPQYFLTMTASGSQQYHPAEMNVEGGLFIHNLAMLECMEDMIKGVNGTRLPLYEVDILRVAILIHDAFKYGTQKDYERMAKKKAVRATADHGQLVANEFAKFAKGKLPSKTIKDICMSVEKHMGIYDSIPNQGMDVFWILSVSDYIVSRKGHHSKEAKRVAKMLEDKV